MSMNPTAMRELAAIDYSGSRDAAIWLSDPLASQSGDAFASLVDLARLRFGASSFEICDVCNTVNLGSARFCKGCSHKLLAFYAACEDEPKLPDPYESPSLPGRPSGIANRASFNDYAAFALVVNLLAVIAEFMPIQ